MLVDKPHRLEALDALRTLAEKKPHLRIAQIICNLAGGADPFYMTDATLAAKALAEITELEKNK